MDYDLALRTLQSALPTEARAEFNVFEARLRENLRRERLYGSTEIIRAERAEIIDGLNRIALARLNVSFNDLTTGALKTTEHTTPNIKPSGTEHSQATPKLQEELDIPDEGSRSLQRELTETRNNLRLIQERKAEYVFSTEIPLNLIKEERRLLERIAELEQQLGA